jgi:outer membrane protein assembly factor BamB
MSAGIARTPSRCRIDGRGRFATRRNPGSPPEGSRSQNGSRGPDRRLLALVSSVALLAVLAGSGAGASAAAPLDPSRVNWRVRVDLDSFSHDPGVGPDGTIYIPNKFGKTQAINPATGATRWIVPYGGDTIAPISVGSDGTVYVTGGGAGSVGGTDSISALRPDGTLKWMFAGMNAYLLAGPNVGPDGNIYAVSDVNGLGFFSLTPSGQLRFSTGRFTDRGPGGFNLAFGPDRVYFGFEMPGLEPPTFFAYGLDGVLKWRVGQPDKPSSPVAGPNGNVVFLAFPTNQGKSVWSYSPAGQAIYKFYEFPGNVQEAPDVGTDNVAYVSRNLNTVLALNPTGTVKWRYTDTGMTFKPRVNRQNTVVFMGGILTYGQAGFFRALTTGGQPLFQVALPDEPGFAEYGQLVPTSRPVFSPDGGTAYSLVDVAGDGNLPYADVYAYLYSIDTRTTGVTPPPPTSIPVAAPTNLSGRPVSASRADLSWSDASSNETGFSIERCTGARCTSFVAIGSVGANTRAFSDTKVPGRGTYSYRVRGFNAGSVSPYSNRAKVQTS